MEVYYEVNGKKFNPNKAELIASSKIPGRDAGYDKGTGEWTELYRTKKGNWVFLHVTLFVKTEKSYAELTTEEEAKKFILKYGSPEMVEKYCNDVEEI